MYYLPRRSSRSRASTEGTPCLLPPCHVEAKRSGVKPSQTEMCSSTLFASDVAGVNENVRHLFLQPTPQADDSLLFSAIDIPSLTSRITSRPLAVSVVPPPLAQNVPSSTLFGTFCEDVHLRPSSPVSSVSTLPQEHTEHTLPDSDDSIWQDADSFPTAVKKVSTWETFGAGRVRPGKTPVNLFVTEQSPQAFDLVLQRQMNHIYAPNESGVVVDEYLFREVLLACDFIDKKSVSSLCLLVENPRYSIGILNQARSEILFPTYGSTQ